MHFQFKFLALLSIFIPTISALTLPKRYTNTTKNEVVHQFPNPTWVENIAIRNTGQLLVTIASAPQLFLIDPNASSLAPTSNNTATLIYSFPQDALLGITETTPNQFFVASGNLSVASGNFGFGTYAVYSVDLTHYNSISNEGAIVEKVTAIPEAQILNGMATLDASQNKILLADSVGGVLFLLDVKTGDYSVFLNETETQPPTNGTGIQLGVNGVKVLPKGNTTYIYFSNTDQELFCRFPVSSSTFAKTGPIEILATGISIDDFALDVEKGAAFLASDNPANSFLKIGLDGGDVKTVLGGPNETILLGPTSVAIGRDGFIYIVDNGGLFAPVNGSFTEGGKVLAVDRNAC